MQADSIRLQEPVQSQETESLVRRLAGPSSGKAGLANDQSEINRIIAEVSKGSKFYENEKRRDKELTERINKILNIRDEVVKGVDISKIEANVDRLLAEFESQRDLTQIIVHVDMDAFYASVELLNNPELKGKPFGAILSTASYEARKYGVRSGMAGFVAKKLCPDLILIPEHFTTYMETSDQVMSIFKRYDPNMLIAGCDEGYLNITLHCEEHSVSAADCVQEMRRIVFEETKLTVSAGIAPNKMLAKICSDRNKPNGQFQLIPDRKTILAFMRELSVRKVFGIGRVNERLLESIGIKTCGDIFTHRATIALMDKQFGLHYLLKTYLGISSNEVRPPQREERKSIGSERTFSPLDDGEVLLQKLEHIASELETDMARNGWAGKTITLKYKLDTYQVFTRAKSLDRYVSSKEDLFSIGRKLFLAEGHLKLRLIGLRVTKLKDLRAPSPAGIKKFFEATTSSAHTRRKLDPEDIHKARHDYDNAEDLHIDAMPGFYEHEETMHDIEVGDIGNDDEVGALELVQDKVKSKPRPPVSAPSRSLSSPAQVCPICRQILKVDNRDLNTHIDLCLSRSAVREASNTSGGAGATENSTSSSTLMTRGWSFLMTPKDTSSRPKKRKRK
ncbi:hypothetical protein AGABI1DRAFT_55621 [Agaricus bisporus var. burnettii JB137-S8]|uniref:DNA polymerase kappa n=1 Tax=Agaricus bisporus var. burnettii (strain JB137-S8 / ATCC MYA-4627 / FGSC 10392) TaxID=597362 RepID=K5WYS1_AGABU|nr:uncharacterized protein AGABI1DRAFT_55621 [Agaricus bisporus var. burnettii JB137-S8]EKM80636.1 hypothetical protein AGABI1DRAFT_55621 [Agaricus bisporus var. burnettii JB137-S8]